LRRLSLNTTSVPPSSEVANTSFSMRGCKVGRGQLDRIWTLATKDFAADAYIDIKTERKGSGITSNISGKTIDDLFLNVKRSMMAGDPDRIDNIMMTIWEVGPGGKHITIFINKPGIEGVLVTVDGNDPGWVVGRATGLKDLFSSTRARFVLPFGGSRVYIATIGVLIAVLLMIPVSRTSGFAHNEALKVTAGIAVSVFLGGCGFLWGARLDRTSRTELLIPSPVTNKSRDWVNLAVLVVAIISVVVAVVAILVAHSDAVHARAVLPVGSTSKTVSAIIAS
jgi:hypothetical protein